MLNISENNISHKVDTGRYVSFQKLALYRGNRSFRRWLLGLLVMLVVALFLPWTQNIQTQGQVTTLNPGERPQTIHATIAGRVERWYVREGQLVKKGDTIVHLSEVKTEYFDPKLVERTASQVSATEGSMGAYDDKVGALEQQIAAMQQELNFKQKQLRNKVRQARLKITSDSIEIVRAKVDFDIAQKQYDRTKELYDKGLKSLTDLEQKNLKVQETAAKKIEAENKWLTARNELDNAQLEFFTTQNEYANKIAKAQSDKFSTESEQFGTETKLNKLRTELENYRQRAGFYYITAPQDCYVTQAVVAGVGETVKEGAPVVSIMPAGASLAVEMFVKPIDLPLVRIGSPVNFIFDGWPAFVFSGWPDLNYGTFAGKVYAVDNNISLNGAYRVLVAPDPQQKAWPDALRPGGGARCVALLNDVPLWYELWRKINSFPPDFYAKNAQPKNEKSDAKK